MVYFADTAFVDGVGVLSLLNQPSVFQQMLSFLQENV